MCLARFQRMGQQLQQGIMLTGVVYAIAAAQLMKMIMCQKLIEQPTLQKLIQHPSFTRITSAYISNT